MTRPADPAGSDTPAAELLDRLAAAAPRGRATPPPGPKADGADFRAAALAAVVAARPAPPPWWDSAAGRVAVRGADLRKASLRSADLSGAGFEQADFAEADLAGAAARGALLSGAVFDRALLEEADLGGASLRFSSFREAVLEGATLRAADLWGAKLPEADADGADFTDAQLEEADFRAADARGAVFRGARLGLADFRGADLRTADFRGSLPRAAKFDRADLRRAHLEQLDLTNSSLAGVRLSDAHLDRTRFHRDQLGPAVGEEVAGEWEPARRAYLSLERNFAEVGDPEAASWAYRRRRRMEKFDTRRRAWDGLRAGRRAGVGPGLSYLGLKLVELVCDYGESVGRVAATYLVVFVLFWAGYAAAGAVVREADGDPGRREVTRSAVDTARYSLTAMIAPGNPPENLHPAGDLTHLMTLCQSFAGVFLTGLLGFVAGNRIRR